MTERGAGAGIGRAGGLLAAALLALCALLADAPGLAAQERPDTARPAPDSLAADTTLTPRERAELRVRQRLEVLARPPGLAPDTLPEEGGRRDDRPGAGRGDDGSAPDSIARALMALEGYRATRYTAVAARYKAPEDSLILYGGLGVPGAEPPDTLTTEETRSIQEAVDRFRQRADSLTGVVARSAADTAAPATEEDIDPAELVARADSLRSLADSLANIARPGGEEGIVRATLSTPDGYRIEAERFIAYNQRTDVAVVRGDPTYAQAGADEVEADSLNIDVGGERASAFEARTRYQQPGGTNWNVRGDLPYVGRRVTYGRHTRFTSCDQEDPHYHFETDNLKIIQGRILVARPVRLYFADVPVAWLPFVAQSLADGRASGLLTPRFSVNDIVRTSGGYRRRVSNIGFYWAMSSYSDATVALDWFDDNYTALTGSLRFRWLRQFLDGSFNFRQFWRVGGSTEQSFDSQARWEVSERTRFSSSIRYVTSTDFVRRNSFDPREVTQRITSSGGLSHRFDWGSLNVTGNRTQSLSNDEVNMSLPDVSLSMNTLTLFEAPASRAKWYNNVSWGGSAKFNRTVRDRAEDSLGFSFSRADVTETRVQASTSFTLGRLSLGQSVTLEGGAVRNVPLDSLIFFPELAARQGLSAFDTRLGQAALADQQDDGEGQRVDVSEDRLRWSTSLSYQQNLIGSTTLTPNLSLSGEALRSDTVEVAQSFVSAPSRLSFGASLKADVYGFYPGFGGFEAIRHKLTPSISYDWAPEVEPTDLQVRVFGSRVIRPRSAMSVTLNQTWEAKRRPDETADTASAGEASVQRGEGQEAEAGLPPGEEPVGVTDAPPEVRRSDAGTAGDVTGPRRLEQGEIVNLLSIRTSAIRYDFVEADSVGDFLAGFESTTLRNQISSDYLRGLTLSMTHDLFDENDEGGRKFAPHLRSMNFGFSLDPSSAILGILGLGAGESGDEGRAGEGRGRDDRDPTADDPFAMRSATDEMAILPGEGTDDEVREAGSARLGRRGGRGWQARFSYALNRPRAGGRETSQILQISLSMSPTSQWEMGWNTAYDIETGAFNDHRIRLTRDLHRWQANFDFLKTATGNWSFRFEVSLLDNEDLKFDYEQRSIENLGGLRPGRLR